ncbi:MAG: glyceraldehyde 3-phosphate dehydrogenase NAD-binding domain-containing protein, partial [Paracoccaceae bacterium]
MSISVAINGFGRIGRNILRAIVESGRTDIRVVAINDLGPVESNAHLLRFDSVHGRFPKPISTTDTTIDVGYGPIAVTAIRDPADLPWTKIDIILECTGIFRSKEDCAAHLSTGAKRVLISAPAKGVDKTIVYGINHGTLTASDIVVSNAS